MSQISQLSCDVPIKSRADKFYRFVRYKLPQLVQMFPLQILSFEFLEGNDFIAGSVLQWSCNIVGPTTIKIRVKGVDELNKTITYEVVGGDILNLYSSIKIRFQVSDKGILGGATVNLSFEFEKVNESVPSPQPYIDFLSTVVTVGVDAYLLIN